MNPAAWCRMTGDVVTGRAVGCPLGAAGRHPSRSQVARGGQPTGDVPRERQGDREEQVSR